MTQVPTHHFHARRLPYEQHGVALAAINPNAVSVISVLHEAGFQAYLVGGCVRDLLLGRQPKDYDIATDARPEEIKSNFRSCFLIGRRFRIAHVRLNREVFEVTTFRGQEAHGDTEVSEHGILLADNFYGTLEEDALRRDFTVNALYYDIADQSIIDFCDGLSDLQHKVLRLIGDPKVRFREDPVRLLRAIRFAAKLGFEIENKTHKQIDVFKALLLHMSPARLYLEMQKLLLSGAALQGYQMLYKAGIFQLLLPSVWKACYQENNHKMQKMIEEALTNTDQRIKQDKTVTPIFLFAVFFWQNFQDILQDLLQKDVKYNLASIQAFEKTLPLLLGVFAIPKRSIVRLKEIWRLQKQLETRRPRQCLRLLANPKFRIAYDFLLLRANSEPKLEMLATWWTTIQVCDDEARQAMIQGLSKGKRFGEV